MSINIDKVRELYNNVMIGRYDPVVLLSPMRDLMEELEACRKVRTKPETREERVAAEREKLQLKMFEEVSNEKGKQE